MSKITTGPTGLHAAPRSVHSSCEFPLSPCSGLVCDQNLQALPTPRDMKWFQSIIWALACQISHTADRRRELTSSRGSRLSELR